MVKTSGKSVKIYHLTENGLDIQVTKKAIRNMYLRVGADGSVRVSAPLRMPEHDIRRFIRERSDWIEAKRQGKRKSPQPGNYMKARSGRKRSGSAEHVWRKYCLRSYGSVKREWVSTPRSGACGI